MGSQSGPPPHDPKQEVAGHPSGSMPYDYHQVHYGYPPPPTAGAPPYHQGYPPSQMSQPPPPGYGPSQYHPYPNPPYQQQPCNYYYNYNPNYPNHPNHPNPEPHYQCSSTYGRRMLIILLILLITTMFLMTLITCFMFRNYVPEFKVSTLQLSNFTVNQENKVSGTWHVELSIHSMNKEHTISFEGVASSIHYRDALLGVSSADPFQVSSMQQYFLHDTIRALDNKQEGDTMVDLSDDLGHGSVVFNLRMYMLATFRAQDNEVYGKHHFKLWCANLEVKFSSAREAEYKHIIGNSCVIRISQAE